MRAADLGDVPVGVAPEFEELVKPIGALAWLQALVTYPWMAMWQCGSGISPHCADHSFMLVRHTMTKNPLTVGPDDRCLDVLRKMHSRGFRHAPVVAEGKLVGVVSERDLLRALPHLVGSFEGDAGARSLSAPIRSVMSLQVRTCSPSDPVDLVAREMLENRLGCMAVASDGELVGVVTTTDLLRGFTDHLLAEDARVMTFVWTKGKLSSAPDIASLAAASGVRLVAYFATETTTGALALLVRALGDEDEYARFVDGCVSAGLLLMASRSAA